MARADYRHKKQSGGAGQFGEVHLIVEPYTDGMPDPTSFTINGQEFKMNIKSKEEKDLEWGGKLVFINSVVGGAIDMRFMPAILKGIMERMEQGPLTGSYARDVRVIVYDGKMHPVDSNELSFMLAARNAFSAAFKEAGPKVLEPIYDLEVLVPGDYMGDVMSDLQGRRFLLDCSVISDWWSCIVHHTVLKLRTRAERHPAGSHQGARSRDERRGLIPSHIKKGLATTVNPFLIEKEDCLRDPLSFSEPLVGFEPTTPRLQITCSGQLS